MAEKDSIFLTAEQAIEAVCLDFRQYDPQILLFSEILRILSTGDRVATRERGKDGLWINLPGQRHMRWLEGSDLIDTLCGILRNSNPDPVLLAAVCARVFQTRAFPGQDSSTGRSGVRIMTGMEDFHCHQCGQCCRALDYHNEITGDDVAYWQHLGREDILAWVGVFPKQGRKTVYRIWMKPGTREFAETCPFLKKEPSENRCFCQIHDVKPRICRQYPVSRKHAVMTGCPGFRPRGSKDS